MKQNNNYLKTKKKFYKIINLLVKRIHKKSLVVIKVGRFYEFHTTKKDIKHILHKKQSKNAQEVFTVSVDDANKLKNYLCNTFASMAIKQGSTLYDITLQQIIDCIKQCDCKCYAILNTKMTECLFFDARGTIFDSLPKDELNKIINDNK